MAPTGQDFSVRHHDGLEAKRLIDALCDVYAHAYSVPQGTKTSAFQNRAEKALTLPDFDLVTAATMDATVGFAFGYPLSESSRWWHGLTPDPGEEWRAETGERTFVLAEIEVRKDWQGCGIGRLLHDSLLGSRKEERATLATSPDAETQQIYAHWGWQRRDGFPARTTIASPPTNCSCWNLAQTRGRSTQVCPQAR
jgi:GNAT superfamily N-acetyltransferase